MLSPDTGKRHVLMGPGCAHKGCSDALAAGLTKSTLQQIGVKVAGDASTKCTLAMLIDRYHSSIESASGHSQGGTTVTCMQGLFDAHVKIVATGSTWIPTSRLQQEFPPAKTPESRPAVMCLFAIEEIGGSVSVDNFCPVELFDLVKVPGVMDAWPVLLSGLGKGGVVHVNSQTKWKHVPATDDAVHNFSNYRHAWFGSKGQFSLVASSS